MSHLRSIPFGRPWITDDDRKAVLEVLEGDILTHGPQCKAFESEFGAFLGDDVYCVAVSSCMAALHLSYLHFGIGPGDEVILPAQTHTATAHAAEWVGARPVFIDCDANTGNITAQSIAAALTPRTRALGIVHFLGIPCAMPEIMALAEKHHLTVIEDCALALGARYRGKHVGLFGDAGCFSFYPVKHITTGEGGMFVSRHRHVSEAVTTLRAFGVDRGHAERAIPGIYDVPILGLNYRMSEMQAALGRTQLRRINDNLGQRRSNFETLKKTLQEIRNIRLLDVLEPEASSSHYCLSIVLEGALQGRRNEIADRLKGMGIGTSIYYPHPVPRLGYYNKKYGYDGTRFSEAVHISDNSLAFPVGPHVRREDLEYIAIKFEQLVKEMN